MSERRTKANTTNALASTGPKTLAGKARAAKNALQHGILSREVVIRSGAGAENSAEYAALHAALRDDLDPRGALEELLVEKLAAVTWRWRRVLRFEAGAIRADSDEPVSAESLKLLQRLEEEVEYQTEFERELTPEKLNARKPSEGFAVWLLHALDRQGIDVDVMFDLEGADLEERAWTKADLERALRAYAEQIGTESLEHALWDVRFKMTKTLYALRPQVVALRLKHEREALLASLPYGEQLERLIKYEATLSREMERTLSQLERARALRSQPELVLEAERGEDGTFQVKAS